WADMPATLDSDQIRYVPSLERLDEADSPHVVFLADEPPAEHATPVGVDAIVHPGAAPGHWYVDITDTSTAVLHPLGLPVRPQLLSPRDWTLISETLDTARAEPGSRPTESVP